MIDESGEPLIAAVALHDRTAPPHAPFSSDDAAGHIPRVRRRAHALRSARRRTTRWWRRDRAARRCLGPRERSKLVRAAGRRVRAQPGWCRTTDGAGPRMAPVHGWRRTTDPSRERRESALTGAPTPVPSGGSFAGRSSCGSSRATDETSVCRSASSLLLRVDARLALALSTPPRASGSPPPKGARVWVTPIGARAHAPGLAIGEPSVAATAIGFSLREGGARATASAALAVLLDWRAAEHAFGEPRRPAVPGPQRDSRGPR